MVILVTGVSSGFGLAISRSLVENGHIVYGTVRSDVAPVEGVRYLRMDVQDDAQVKAAVDTVIREQGVIDVLISNAGYGVGGPLEFIPMDDVHKQMDVNFTGLVRLTKEVLPHMRRRREGKIVAFSSIGGLMGLPFQGCYSASKFAVEGFCEALRIELRSYGIKVVVIEPGDFHTEFTAKRKKVSDPAAFEAYPSYARGMEGIEKDENNGLTPAYLAGRIVKIVQKRNPRCSYVIASPVQKLSVFVKKVVPPMWFSRILAMFYKV